MMRTCDHDRGRSLRARRTRGARASALDMALTRLDCGTPQAPIAVNQRFSDTFAYGDLKLQFVFSCYLVKHDNDYLLWDTGHSMTAPNVAPKVSWSINSRSSTSSPSRSSMSASATITPTTPARWPRFRKRRC